MIGRVLGHYQILEQIGAGGMGIVYRARDQRLQRDIALKVLPAGMLSDEAARGRFCKEALSLSRLNHPNIETVFDFDTQEGTDFLALEYIPGMNLEDKLRSGPLSEKETIRLAIQLAEGLAAAHQQGVVHRDIKPANLRLTPDGRLKILDFGLARLTEPVSDVAVTITGTRPEAVPGTLPYMAPEQLLGEKADARTDIYAMGLVLYEMATGRRVFPETISSRLVDAILHRPPVPPRAVAASVSLELERIILKCQEKDPESRYQSAGEVAVDLKRLARESELSQPVSSSTLAAAPPKGRVGSRRALLVGAAAAVLLLLAGIGWWSLRQRSFLLPRTGQVTVAVLPFQSASADASTDFLRMGIADEVVTALSHLPSVSVRPFAMSMKYGKEGTDVQAAARELRVSRVVTGQYLRQGEQLRVTLEVMDANSGSLLWRDSVTGGAQDLIGIQQQLMARVRGGLARAVGASLPAEVDTARPANPEAFDLYLRSAAVPYEIGPNREAVTMLERAVGLDPRYAPAWNALGLRYSVEAGVGLAKCPCEPLERTEYVKRAKAAYERALALDPNLSDAAAALVLFLVDDGDLNNAYDRAQQMLRQRPQSAEAHFSLGYVLRYAGLLDDAAHECDTALGLDPGNFTLRSCAITFMQLGKYERAMDFVRLDGDSEWAARTSVDILLRQDPSGGLLNKVPTRVSKAPAYLFLRACMARRPAGEINRLAFDLELQMSGSEDAEPDYFLAAYQAFCGQNRGALRVLRRAIEHKYCSYPAIESDPFFAELRKDPDFARVRSAAMDCQRDFLSHTAGRRGAETAPKRLQSMTLSSTFLSK